MRRAISKIVTFTGLIAITFVVSCDIPCIRGEGATVTENRETGIYHSLKLKIPATVFIKQGAEIKTKIEAQANLLENIETEVVNKRLVITSKKCIGDNRGIKVYITLPELQFLGIEGSGDIKSDTAINVKKLELVISGSGGINLDVNADLVYCGIKGSGEMDLSGAAKQQYVKIDGSGNYQAARFPSENTEIQINGSGDADVFAISKLKVEINGSGSVNYHGNPEIKSHINGSGDINRR